MLRYLAAFGPASVRDAQAWSGLAKLDGAFERLRPRLVTFRDARGTELFDLPDAPRPDPGTPSPPRFLPEYDNVLLGHANRTRIVSAADRRRAADGPGWRALLVDGFGGGLWKLAAERGTATLQVALFARPDPATRDALVSEGDGLLALLAPDAGAREVRFVDPA